MNEIQRRVEEREENLRGLPRYIFEETPAWQQRRPISRRNAVALHLYFIQCGGEDGPIKIGKGTVPRTRLSSLQSGCPYELRLLAVIPTAAGSENPLHERFAAYHIRGEWFRCNPELLEMIRVHQNAAPDLVAPSPRPGADPTEMI